MQKTDVNTLSKILEKIREKGNQRPQGAPGHEQGHFTHSNSMEGREHGGPSVKTWQFPLTWK